MAALTGFLSPTEQLKQLREEAMARRMAPVQAGQQAFMTAPDPVSRASALGSQLGSGIAAAFNPVRDEELKQDPAYQKAATRSGILENLDLTNREDVRNAAKMAADAGDLELQLMMTDRFLAMQPEESTLYSDVYESTQVPGIYLRRNLKTNKVERAFTDPRSTGGKGADKIDIPSEPSGTNIETAKRIISDEASVLQKQTGVDFPDLDDDEADRFARLVAARAQELQALAKAGGGSIDSDTATRTAIKEKANLIQSTPQFFGLMTEPKLQVGAGGQATTGGGVPTPTTQQEFDALPSGATYRDPDDGQLYRKP